MKKSAVSCKIVAIVLLVAVLVGCKAAVESGQESGYIIEPPARSEPGVDSAGVTVAIIDDVTTSSDKIRFRTSGANAGDYLVFYFGHRLERLSGSEWIPVPVTYDSSQYLRDDPDYYWHYGHGKIINGEMTMTFSISTADLCEKITFGNYRVCVFLPDRNIYAPFTVTE